MRRIEAIEICETIQVENIHTPLCVQMEKPSKEFGVEVVPVEHTLHELLIQKDAFVDNKKGQDLFRKKYTDALGKVYVRLTKVTVLNPESEYQNFIIPTPIAWSQPNKGPGVR